MEHKELKDSLSKVGTYECRLWSANIFDTHRPISLLLQYNYVRTAKRKGSILANRELLALDKRLRWTNGASIAFDDSEIKSLALFYSGACKQAYDRTYRATLNVRTAAIPVRSYIREKRILEHFKKNWETKKDDEVLSLCLKTFDEKWWRRKLRKMSARAVETVLRDLGYVNKKNGVYVSNYGFQKIKTARKRNNEFIDSMTAVAENGETVPLRNAVDGSISNPKVRRADLMVRMRGQEEQARELNLACLFITMTCPSRFHAVLGKSGRRNTKFDGSNTTDCINYLNRIWRQIRADYGKAGINVVGFRVCEPHHDGTPHFHFLVYLEPKDSKQFQSIFWKHNLKIDGDEKGAAENRCDIQELDLVNGSPTGYLAKYIAKNIDGDDVGIDHEAELESKNTASRVIAWASLWSIRQFQQLGGTSATVYREFRRIREELTGRHAKEAEAARKASDNSDFNAFIAATGGLFVKRKDALFRAFHIVKEKKTIYGEQVTKLIGLVTKKDYVIQTRFLDWVLKPTSMLVVQEAAQPPPLEYWQ